MFSNIGPLQLLIVFLIVLLIFGTKKLRNMGGDLGSAIRDFRKGMNESDNNDENKETVEKSTVSDAADEDVSNGAEDNGGKSRNAGS